MQFDPLGAFRAYLTAPLDEHALSLARAFYGTLPYMPYGDVTRLYYHWSGAAYGCTFTEYTASVSLKKGAWALSLTHDPRDNALSTFSDNYAAATYCRNEGSLSICVDAMLGAAPNAFAGQPIQMHEVVIMCAGAAALCSKYEIDVSGASGPGAKGAYAGEPNAATHSEAANWTGIPWQYVAYGPECGGGDGSRWDFATIATLPEGVALTQAMVTQTGDALRLLTHRMKLAL